MLKWILGSSDVIAVGLACKCHGKCKGFDQRLDNICESLSLTLFFVEGTEIEGDDGREFQKTVNCSSPSSDQSQLLRDGADKKEYHQNQNKK